MRGWVLMCGVVLGCRGDKPETRSEPVPHRPAAADAGLPLITGPATAVPNARPAALLWIDQAGELAVGAVAGTNFYAAARDTVSADKLQSA